MELNYFRDRLFDLLNDSEGMGIADLNEQAGERLDLIMEQMKAAEGVTDESVRRESPVCPHHVDTFA